MALDAGCTDAQIQRGPCPLSTPAPLPCTKEYDPVCVTGSAGHEQEFGNECMAKAAGYDSSQIIRGHCPSHSSPAPPTDAWPHVPKHGMTCTAGAAWQKESINGNGAPSMKQRALSCH